MRKTSTGTNRGNMDYSPNRTQKILFWVLIILLPLILIAVSYLPVSGLTRLIYFGSDFSKNALPAVQAVPHALVDGPGYDGQFYAQVALDPLLRDPALSTALDNPAYRSKRILLPILAYLTGLGQTAMVLNSYALLNFVFYLLLIYGLIRFVKPTRLRDFICIIPICWGTGSILSLARSLTDFPATVLLFFTLWSGNDLPVLLACLCRETTLINLLGVVDTTLPLQKNIRRMALILLPFSLWGVFVSLTFGMHGFFGSANFSFPFVSLARQLYLNALELIRYPGFRSISEMAAILSFCIQAVYLASHPSKNPIWKAAIGSVILFLCLGPSVLVQDLAYARVILPLSFGFNLLLIQEDRRFLPWFAAGNIGAFGGLARVLMIILSVISPIKIAM